MSIKSYFSKSNKNGSSKSPGSGKNEKPTPQMFHDKFLSMPLEEKRKLYKCRSAYVTLDDIPIWPCLYKVEASRIQKLIRTQREKKSERTFKFKEDEDIPKKPLQRNDAINPKVSLWQGDITSLEIDAIVNAANETLLGGGGVDGCIHRAAGDTLRDECMFLGGASSGEAKATCGHRLPAKYVLHTVGPRGKKPDKLRSCYENCFKIVEEKGLRSVAFCCISTGIFGYPNRDAAHVALLATRKFLERNHENIDRVIFCTFLAEDFKIYQELMADKYFPCVDSSESTDETGDTESGETEAASPVTEEASKEAVENEWDTRSDRSDDGTKSTTTSTEDAKSEKESATANSAPTPETNRESEDKDQVEGDRDEIAKDNDEVAKEKNEVANGKAEVATPSNESEEIEMNSQGGSQDLMDIGGNSQDVMEEPESQDDMDLGSQQPV